MKVIGLTGDIVFGNPESLSRLNQIMHPRMYNMVKAQLEEYRQQGMRVVVLTGFRVGLPGRDYV